MEMHQVRYFLAVATELEAGFGDLVLRLFVGPPGGGTLPGGPPSR